MFGSIWNVNTIHIRENMLRKINVITPRYTVISKSLNKRSFIKSNDGYSKW